MSDNNEIEKMDRFETFTGKSVEDCKNAAAEQFGVPVESIVFSVIEEEKRGLFGKIKSEAKVMAGYNYPKEEIISEETAAEETAAAAPVEMDDEKREKLSIAEGYIKRILGCMEIEANVSAVFTENGINVEIDSQGSGAIIGRRGETLDSIQYLTSLAVNRVKGEYTRVSLDSCGYRDKREETLRALAKKIAEKAVRTGRSTTLEPMNPYERRIIHSTVSEIEGVNSRSVGEEPYRKVVISSDNPRRRERDSGKKGGGRKKFDGPRSLDLKTSFEKDYKRPKPEDDIHAGLYGKIEL